MAPAGRPCRAGSSTAPRSHRSVPGGVHLRARKVLVAVVDRFELAAVNRDARLRQKADRSAKGNKLRTHSADRRSVILAEIGNRLVIGNQPTGKPHDFNVAGRLTLKPTARLNPVEIPVDVELQQHRRMIRGPAGDPGSTPSNRSSARSSLPT